MVDGNYCLDSSALAWSNSSPYIGLKRTSMMCDCHESLIRARFRQIRQDFHPVLKGLARHQIFLPGQRVSKTTPNSIRVDLKVLKRWSARLQQEVDTVRHGVGLDFTDQAMDLLMLTGVTPPVRGCWMLRTHLCTTSLLSSKIYPLS